MNELKKFLMTFDGYIAQGLLSIMTVILFYEVVTRYIFGHSSALNSELCGVSFVWFVYLSISFITGQRNHIVVDIASMIFPKRMLLYIDLIGDIIFLAFSFVMFWYGTKLVISTFEYPFKLAISGISMGIPYAVLPIAFGIMTIRLVIIIMMDINAIRSYSPAPEGGDNA